MVACNLWDIAMINPGPSAIHNSYLNEKATFVGGRIGSKLSS